MPVPVRLEHKKCAACDVAAVAGDDWREHGYFVFGDYAVHIHALVSVRSYVANGTPITTAWSNHLGGLSEDRRFWDNDPVLVAR